MTELAIIARFWAPEEGCDDRNNNAQDVNLSDDNNTSIGDVADDRPSPKISKPTLIIERQVRKDRFRHIYNGTCSWCWAFFLNHLPIKRWDMGVDYPNAESVAAGAAPACRCAAPPPRPRATDPRDLAGMCNVCAAHPQPRPREEQAPSSPE
jgi:hypothetical protein